MLIFRPLFFINRIPIVKNNIYLFKESMYIAYDNVFFLYRKLANEQEANGIRQNGEANAARRHPL